MIPRTNQMTHILEDLTHKINPVNPLSTRGQLGTRYKYIWMFPKIGVPTKWMVYNGL